MTQILAWFQANSAVLWFLVSIMIILTVWIIKRLQSGEDPQAIALALAHEAIAAALIVVRGAADQIQRGDLDVIVAFLYIRVPPIVEAVFPLATLQQLAWDTFQKLHADLDTSRKAQIIGLVKRNRAARSLS